MAGDPDPGPAEGWPVEIACRTLADVERWCAEMRNAGAADSCPVLHAVRRGALVLGGWPRATTGPMPPTRKPVVPRPGLKPGGDGG